MGSRYSLLIVSDAPSLESVMAAVGAAGFEKSGSIEAPIPEGKIEPNAGAWATLEGWGVLALGYGAGNTGGLDASSVARELVNNRRLRYFVRDDTSGELCAQSFESGVLVRSYAQVDGACIQSRLIGPPPPQNEYEQTDSLAFLSELLPDRSTLGAIEASPFAGLRITWSVTKPQKKGWWPWRRAS
jgi:hypothetical protein